MAKRARSGFKLSKATRERMRQSALGRKITPATKAKISATMRRKWALIEAAEANAQVTATA